MLRGRLVTRVCRSDTYRDGSTVNVILNKQSVMRHHPYTVRERMKK